MHYVLDVKELLDEDGEEYVYYWLEPLLDDDLEWPWLQGERFNRGPREPLRFKVDPNADAGAFADYVSGPVPLVTRELRQVFDACGVTNIDYFPVSVEGADAFENFPEYLAMNVVGLVCAAAPGTLSTRTFGTAGADLIDRFVFDESAAGSLHLFRLAEHLSTLIVSESVKRACESANLETLNFVPSNEWTT